MTDHTWQSRFPHFSCSCGQWSERAGGPDEERYTGFAYRQWEHHVKEATKPPVHVFVDEFPGFTCKCGQWQDVPLHHDKRVAWKMARKEWEKHLHRAYRDEGDPELDPAKVAVELLSVALPAFRTIMRPERDVVRMEGALPIAQEVSAQYFAFPTRSYGWGEPDAVGRAIRDVVETPDIRAARMVKERLRVEEDLQRQIAEVVLRIREFAIDAVTLGPYIEEKEQAAFERGQREGFAQGKSAGVSEGRQQVMAEFVAAQKDVDARLAQITGEEGHYADPDDFS